jgi:hypothetical protein
VTIERVLGTLWFRSLFAIVCLALHLEAATTMGEQRFGVPFNAAPSSAPAFADVKHDREARNASRLVVARWDAQHYIGQALRGYTQCPQTSVAGQDLKPYLPTCDLSFYPTYPLVGRVLSFGGRVPIDYALLGVSLVSSFLLFLMWTSRSITARLGMGGAYASLVIYNAFTTGFTFVAIQTEPLFLALTLAAFLAFDRRWYLLGALAAGAATSIRVSGAATGFAYGLALLVATLDERPRSPLAWAQRGVELLLPGWGFFALLAYNAVRFGDALVYFHAHSQLFSHSVGFTTDPETLVRSLDMPLHEGLFVVVTILFFLLGHRDALRRFSVPGQVFWYALVVVGLGISLLGSFGLSFSGMNRYLLQAMPIFFAMGMLMRKKPVLLCAWLAFSIWHYWQAELCIFTGGPGNHTLMQCHDAHWIGHF